MVSQMLSRTPPHKTDDLIPGSIEPASLPFSEPSDVFGRDGKPLDQFGHPLV